MASFAMALTISPRKASSHEEEGFSFLGKSPGDGQSRTRLLYGVILDDLQRGAYYHEITAPRRVCLLYTMKA